MKKPFTLALKALLCLCMSALLTTNVQAQTWLPYFGNSHFGYSTGSFPNTAWPKAIRLADLDADGDLDAIVAQGNGTGFAVLTNQGGGYYGSPVNYPTGHASEDALVADFTGDGIPDVVASNTGEYSNGTTVSLFPGLGNGLFGSDSAYTVGTGPVGLAAADFNLDGLLDLAVANHGWGGNDSTVSILLNAPGGFLPAQSLVVAPGPYQLATGYMNADTVPDLVIAHSQQRVTVLLNTLLGLQADTSYQMQAVANWASQSGFTVALGDIDQDQDLDVLYSSNRTWDGTSGQIAIRTNNGSGQLDSVQTITLNSYSNGATSLQLADLNSDGMPDIVANNGSGGAGDGYRVLLNQGGGNFGPVTVRPAGAWTRATAVGDIDLDSDLDVVTLDDYSMQITTHRNSGTGQFATPTLFTAGVPVMAGLIETGDLDNDGDLDLVTSANRRMAVTAPVVVFRNNGNATFTSGLTIATAGRQVKVRDLNGDGFQDLLYIGGNSTGPGQVFSTAYSQGGTAFAAPVAWQVGICAPEDIDAADMDGDGDLDVVVTGGCSSGVVHVSYQDSTGTFGQVVDYPVNVWPGALALGDFNNDQRLDIASSSSDGFDLLLADSAGGFLPMQSFMLDQGPWDLLAADLNDDGNLDLASCNYGNPPGGYNMTVRLGNGDGTFSPALTLPAAYSPAIANVSGITCGDIDNDTDLDLMVANNATNDMSIYLNQGNGTFSAALRAGLYYSARSPIFADFNGDGHCEVAALVSLPPGGFSSAIVVLEGTNTGIRTAGTGLVSAAPETAPALSGALNAWPNPSKGSTQLSFTLKKPAAVSLTVYNLLSQEVAQPLRNANLPAGRQVVTFENARLPKGAYLVRLVSGETVKTLKLVVE